MPKRAKQLPPPPPKDVRTAAADAVRIWCAYLEDDDQVSSPREFGDAMADLEAALNQLLEDTP